MKAARFEIYTKNEKTEERGWEIKLRYVIADTFKEGRKILKTTPFFDCVISPDFIVDIDNINDEIKPQLINLGWADEII